MLVGTGRGVLVGTGRGMLVVTGRGMPAIIRGAISGQRIAHGGGQCVVGYPGVMIQPWDELWAVFIGYL